MKHCFFKNLLIYTSCLFLLACSTDSGRETQSRDHVRENVFDLTSVFVPYYKKFLGVFEFENPKADNPTTQGKMSVKSRKSWELRLQRALKASQGIIENKGQLEEIYQFEYKEIGHVTHYTKVAGGFMYFGTKGIGLGFIKEQCNNLSPMDGVKRKERFDQLAYYITFPEMNQGVTIKGSEDKDGYFNYIKGQNNVGNIPKIRQYKAVTYANLFDFVDLKYYLTDKGMKYDFIVHKGGAVADITMHYNDVSSLRINEKGQLEIGVEWGKLIDEKPYTYQLIDGRKKTVKCRYVKRGEKSIGFQIDGKYSKEEPLYIDPPTVSWSTYVSNAASDNGYINDVAVDGNGDIYITGWANTLMPSTQTIGTFARTNEDIFVYKVSSDGTTLTWGTIITANAGGDQDVGMAIEVNSSGNAYIAGYTASTDFPTVSPVQASNGGAKDIVFAKLSADGSSLLFSSYYGGTLDDGALDMVMESDTMIMTGSTMSSGLATASVYDNTYSSGHDIFVMKVNPDGSLNCFTYFGGTGDDQAKGIDYNDGDVWISGTTNTSGIATVGSYDDTYNGGAYDFIVARFSSDAQTLRWATYIGACCNEYGSHVRVNSNNEAIVIGYGDNTGMATKLPFQASMAGAGDAFLAGVGADGDSLIFATWIGGTSWDNGVKGRSFALTQYWRLGSLDITDSYALVAFETDATDIGTSDEFSITSVNTNAPGAYVGNAKSGSTDYYIGIFDYSPVYSGGNVARHSASYLGGADGQDYPTGGVRLMPGSDCFVIAGNVHSDDFPTTTGVYEAQSTTTLDQVTLTKVCDDVLPVELVNFRGSRTQSGNLLTWTTLTEINNDRFVILRSSDGSVYYEIGQVAGNGNSNSPINYSYLDEQETNGVYYYRLLQVDYDGTESYSQIVAIQNGEEEFSFIAAPDAYLVRYNWDVESNKTLNWQLVAMDGKVVDQGGLNIEPNKREFKLELASHPSRGTYVLIIQSSQTFYSEKVLVE